MLFLTKTRCDLKLEMILGEQLNLDEVDLHACHVSVQIASFSVLADLLVCFLVTKNHQKLTPLLHFYNSSLTCVIHHSCQLNAN